jgi:hypothetical protein
MFQRKVEKAVKRVIWRMSATDPAGSYHVSTDGRPERPARAEVHERGWRASSFDLLSGAEVCETSMDTLPGELVDEFSKSTR